MTSRLVSAIETATGEREVHAAFAARLTPVAGVVQLLRQREHLRDLRPGKPRRPRPQKQLAGLPVEGVPASGAAAAGGVDDGLVGGDPVPLRPGVLVGAGCLTEQGGDRRDAVPGVPFRGPGVVLGEPDAASVEPLEHHRVLGEELEQAGLEVRLHLLGREHLERIRQQLVILESSFGCGDGSSMSS